MIGLLRVGLALILALGILLKVAEPNQTAVAASPAPEIARVLGSALLRPLASDHPRGSLEVFHALVAGCPRPLLIVATAPSFASTAPLQELKRPGDHALFAYVDWASETPDRLAVLARRLILPVPASLGLTPYRRLGQMLFIVEPAGCRGLRAIAWRPFWRR